MSGNQVVDVLIDFETLGGQDHNRAKAMVIELAAIPFVFDPETGRVPEFGELIKQGFRVKFDLKSQKGNRITDEDTRAWWVNQGESARAVLMPTAADVTVPEGMRRFGDWLQSLGLSRDSQLWCRGQDFDIPIFYSCLHEAGVPRNVSVNFWNHRDIRTRIEAMLGRGITNCPIPKGKMPGFIKHNGIHDCAKDILSLFYSYRYAFGMEDIPTESEEKILR
ncbi:exonuclease [Vibrio phage EniLVp02]